MSSIDDRYIRLQALERAMKLYKDSPTVVSPGQVIQAAEKFRAFLAGEGAKPEPFKAELPKFKLPRIGDGYVYYQFNGAEYILYRSDSASGALAPSVERISLRSTGWWRPTSGELSTRQGLRSAANDYTNIPASQARELAVKYVQGYEFV